MNYPQILTALSGCQIDTKEAWEKHRREEILILFQNFVFGLPPIDRHDNLKFDVKLIDRDHDIIQKKGDDIL